MEIRDIPIDKIVGSLCRMRLEFDYEKDELLASIRKYGVMNPIKVKAVKSGYLIFAGHRRRDCAAELGHKNIKAEVWEGIADREAAMIGFVDNILKTRVHASKKSSGGARWYPNPNYS